MDKGLELWRVSWGPLDGLTRQEDKPKCLSSFWNTMDSGSEIFEILENMLARNWYPHGDESGLRPTTSEAIEILEKTLDQHRNGSASQTFAFSNQIAFWTSIGLKR